MYVVFHNNQNSSLALNVRYVNYRETLTSQANNWRHMAKCRSFSTNSRVVMRRRSASFKDYYNRVTDFGCEFLENCRLISLFIDQGIEMINLEVSCSVKTMNLQHQIYFYSSFLIKSLVRQKIEVHGWEPLQTFTNQAVMCTKLHQVKLGPQCIFIGMTKYGGKLIC